MVYSGKPSKGCDKCRARKIRCDQQTPSCKQCIKIKFECPGYRNQTDLMFRNETGHVIEKVQRKTKSAETGQDIAKTASPVQQASNAAKRSPVLAFQVPEDAVNHSFYYPSLSKERCNQSIIDDIAVKFFMSHYVGPQAPQREFDKIPYRWYSKHMLLCIQAVGAAGYSRMVPHATMAHAARIRYGQAIQLVTAALQDQATVTNDETLAAVMVLGMFELIITPSRSSLKAYQKHLDGAVMLAKLRGKQQFETETGRGLFEQLKTNVQFNCVVNFLPFPSALQELVSWTQDSSPFGDFVARFDTILCDWIDICAKAEHGKIRDHAVVLSEIVRVDSDIVNYLADLPTDWHYETRTNTAYPELVFEGTYHVYRSLGLVQLWNTLRMCRMRLNKIILQDLCYQSNDTTTKTPPAVRELAVRSLQMHKAIMLDICATVPQMAGYADRLVRSESPPASNDTPHPPHTAASAAAAHSPVYSFIQDWGRPMKIMSHFLNNTFVAPKSGDPGKADDVLGSPRKASQICDPLPPLPPVNIASPAAVAAIAANGKNDGDNGGGGGHKRQGPSPVTADVMQLMWPLFSLRESPFATEGMREWVRDRLMFMMRNPNSEYKTDLTQMLFSVKPAEEVSQFKKTLITLVDKNAD